MRSSGLAISSKDGSDAPYPALSSSFLISFRTSGEPASFSDLGVASPGSSMIRILFFVNMSEEN
jgi:hypothetical protein